MLVIFKAPFRCGASDLPHRGNIPRGAHLAFTPASMEERETRRRLQRTADGAA
jgi:hypothetical protein